MNIRREIIQRKVKVDVIQFKYFTTIKFNFFNEPVYFLDLVVNLKSFNIHCFCEENILFVFQAFKIIILLGSVVMVKFCTFKQCLIGASFL